MLFRLWGDFCLPFTASIACANRLLIIDDFGLQKIEDLQRLDLMEIIEDRHGLTTTIIISQLPVVAWYEVIGEPTNNDAILDRSVAGKSPTDHQLL